jgi:hypothetical protein
VSQAEDEREPHEHLPKRLLIVEPTFTTDVVSRSVQASDGSVEAAGAETCSSPQPEPGREGFIA